MKKNRKEQREPEAAVEPPRRRFLRRAWKLLGLVILAETVWLVVSFLRPRGEDPAAENQTETLTAGRVGDFAPGSVTAFPQGRFYLARLDDGGFLALSRTCTHLGCTVPWIEEERKFVCPCHASAFDIRGEVVTPPAPRALDTYAVRIEGDVVKVDIGEAAARKRFETTQVVYQR